MGVELGDIIGGEKTRLVVLHNVLCSTNNVVVVRHLSFHQPSIYNGYFWAYRNQFSGILMSTEVTTFSKYNFCGQRNVHTKMKQVVGPPPPCPKEEKKPFFCEQA